MDTLRDHITAIKRAHGIADTQSCMVCLVCCMPVAFDSDGRGSCDCKQDIELYSEDDWLEPDEYGELYRRWFDERW